MRAGPALLITFTLALTGCAAPQTKQVQIDPQRRAQEEAIQHRLFLEREAKDARRVHSVAWPILAGAVPLCPETALRAGVGFALASGYQKQYRAAAVDLYGVSEQPTVVHVIPGSAGDRAGLRVRDVVIRAGNTPIAPGEKSLAKLNEALNSDFVEGKDTLLSIRREGVEQSIQLRPDRICNYAVLITDGGEVNAYADGKAIYITKGMLRFAESDDELATVIGHELAHNTMKHIDAKQSNRLLGSLFDIAAAAYGVNTQGAFGNAAAMTYSKEFESEADYVGLYALALSGRSVDESANFWRRMAAESGNVKTQYNSSHPGGADRYLALEETAREIYSKRSEGVEIRPNLKKLPKDSSAPKRRGGNPNAM